MNGKLKSLIVGVSVGVLAIFFGCASFMDALTPAYISPITRDFVDANDVPLPPFKPLLPWWDSLFDLRVIGKRIEFIHQYRQMDESLRYSFATGTNQFFISAGERLQQTLFSPTGLIGSLVPAVSGLGLGALLIPRPGEKKKIEQAKEDGRKEANHKT